MIDAARLAALERLRLAVAALPDDMPITRVEEWTGSHVTERETGATIADLRLLLGAADTPTSPPDPRTHGVTWLLLRDGHVMLEHCPKKAEHFVGGEWFVPGGKLEGYETPLECLRRELGEEWPGMILGSARALPLVECTADGKGARGVFIVRPFAVTLYGDPPMPATASDGTPLQWFPIAEALRSPVTQVRMMMAAALTPEVYRVWPTVLHG